MLYLRVAIDGGTSFDSNEIKTPRPELMQSSRHRSG